MTVVSNTSPISYLLRIGEIEILPRLVGRIAIPQEVRSELSHAAAPGVVRDWIAAPREWLSVHSDQERPSQDMGRELARLHPGERAAILLAIRIQAHLVLLDDKAARTAAAQSGLPVAGLLGVLKSASIAGYLDLPNSVERLRQAGFRVAPALLKRILTDS